MKAERRTSNAQHRTPNRVKSIGSRKFKVQSRMLSNLPFDSWILGLLIGIFFICVYVFSASATESAKIRVSLGTADKIWVGQRVPVYITLITTGRFSGSPKFDLPKISGALLMKLPGRPVMGTEKIDGVSYISQRHEFALFAQRPGAYVIPTFEVRFASMGFVESKPSEHRLTTTEMRVEAKMPPGTEHLPTLISTPDLKVSESWDPQPGESKVGEAFVRTITFRAPDVPGMAFPPLPIDKVDGLGVYPKKPVVRDRMERGDFTGERVESITYVCEQAGQVKLPALIIPWWDVDDQELKRVELPAITLKVAPNPLHQTKAKLEPVATGFRGIPWWLVGSIALLVFVSALLWMLRRPIVVRIGQWKQKRAESEAAYFRRFREACRSGDPANIMRAFMVWLDRSTHPLKIDNLERFVSKVNDPQLKEQIKILESILYGRDQPTNGKILWSGKKFYRSVNRGRKKLKQSKVPYQSRPGELPALNPRV